MVEDYKVSERKLAEISQWAIFSISNTYGILFYIHHPIDRVGYATANVKPVVECRFISFRDMFSVYIQSKLL